MTKETIVGAAEDFMIEVMNDFGAKVRSDALAHVGIDDQHLGVEAIELPQLIFYYQAAYARLQLHESKCELRVKTAEANAFLRIQSGSESARGKKLSVEEVKAHVMLDPLVQSERHALIEIGGKKDCIKGVIDALRQKGYSLQLLASIRSKEEDWLARSFADRFRSNPKVEQIRAALEGVLQIKIQ